MPRPRRPISPSGFLQCSKGGEVKHISEFSSQNSHVVWWTDPSGKDWGKPSSWCKEHMAEHQRSVRPENERWGRPRYDADMLEATGLLETQRDKAKYVDMAPNAPDAGAIRTTPLGPPEEERPLRT